VRKVFLLTCTKRKLDKIAKAKDLYSSPIFQSNRTIAEKLGDVWYILSAMHGLISPETRIGPYDRSLHSLPKSYQIKWAKKVFNSLYPELKKGDQIIILGDCLYAELLAPLIGNAGFDLEIPKSGIGSRGTYNEEVANYNNDLNAFYEMLSELEDGLGGKRTLMECNGRLNWPKRGIYILFEDGETRRFDNVLRVVRIGTHAISVNSKSCLWQRLRTHRGNRNGGGNHRSSILRLHVGAAMISKSNGTINLPTWGDRNNGTKASRINEGELEQKVTEYIGKMKVLWLSINDNPSPFSDRAYIERNVIGLLSGMNHLIDQPSENWLGNHSLNHLIKHFGLWNVNSVGNLYDYRFLDVFHRYMNITLFNKNTPIRSIAPKDWLEDKKGAKRQISHR
jgi:hypothetical protein